MIAIENYNENRSLYSEFEFEFSFHHAKRGYSYNRYIYIN